MEFELESLLLSEGEDSILALYLSHLGRLILIISSSFHSYRFTREINFSEGGNNSLFILLLL